MNKTEHLLYSNCLENIYNCILLGDEESALSNTEELVYLTREMAEMGKVHCSLRDELSLLSHFFRGCFGEKSPEVQNTVLEKMFLVKGNLVNVLVLDIKTLLENGKTPETVTIEMRDEAIHYTIWEQSVAINQGAV